MNTISSQLQRFATKRPPWVGALIRGRRLLNFSFSRGGGRLLEGALKRGWALNRGFTVYIYIYIKIYIYVFFYKKHLYKKHEAEITDPVDC